MRATHVAAASQSVPFVGMFTEIVATLRYFFREQNCQNKRKVRSTVRENSEISQRN